MLVGFAVSVIGTRWFLAFTGYPKIGGGDLHIAHALWGGGLLFVGGLLPLVWAGRRVHDIAAVAVGAGMGLFIDEVGKFITTRNDYFYPAAAPIIYSIFLLATVLFVWVRQRRHDRVTEGSAWERTEPQVRPGSAKQGWLSKHADAWLGGRGLRTVTLVALVIAGIGSVMALGLLTFAVLFIIPAGDIPLITLILMHVGADAVSGLLLLGGAAALVAGRRQLGTSLATAGLLVSLTVADLLSFYLRQFDSIVVVLLHLGLLLAVNRLWRDDGRTGGNR